MIEEFVKAWDARKGEIEAQFRTKRPDDYSDIVKAVVTILNADSGSYDKPDPERITSIDHGDYQGTLLFVISGSGYQPDNYWFVKVGYGSCSGCDTLQAIQGWGEEIPEKEVADYMTLALHILQGIKVLGGETV